MLKRLFFIIIFLGPLFCAAQKNYYIHKAAPKETIYSISRETGVKVKTIIELNPGFTKTTRLSLGQEVRLPQNAQKPVKPDMVISHPQIEKDIQIPVIPDVRTDADQVIALLLPLYSDNVQSPDLLGGPLNIEPVSPKSEQFLQFYGGALMAFDSLKRAGNTLQVHVIDMSDENKIRSQIRQLDSISPDLIIGPVYERQTAQVCRMMQDKSVPVIYPLSSKNASISSCSNVVQLNVSNRTFAMKMKEWLQRKMADSSARLLYFPMNRASDIRNQVIARVAEVPGAVNFTWPGGVGADRTAAMIKQHLNEDGENYIVCPTMDEAELSEILPVLLLCAENYDITLVGLPDWQTFSVVDFENFYKLNVTFLTYSYNDISMPEVKDFSDRFIDYFSVMPSSLACKGYDIALYFGGMLCRYGKIFGSEMFGRENEGLFSTFLFEPMKGNAGIYENTSLYSLTYGRDFKLHINK